MGDKTEPGFRMLNPQICLVCSEFWDGKSVHLCSNCLNATEESDDMFGTRWGTRFTYPRTSQEIAYLRASIETRLGITKCPYDVDVVSYSNVFIDLRRRFDAVAEAAIRGEQFQDHPFKSCRHALNKLCVWCALHAQFWNLAYHEERRWGLPEGSIWKRQQATDLQRRVDALSTADVSEIITRKLGGNSD